MKVRSHFSTLDEKSKDPIGIGSFLNCLVN